MMKTDFDEVEVQRIADEIKRYLADHPEGIDTIDGITRWWLPRQKLQESAFLVKQALDLLVAELLVERKTNPDGTQLYRNARPSTYGNNKHGNY